MYKWAPLNPMQYQREGGFIFINGNTSNLSASTTPTCKFYFCSQALAAMVRTMEMYKQAALNPIQPQRGWELYCQKWKYFLPLYQHHTHRQTLVVIVKKQECINGVQLTILAIKGGFIFKNRNTFGLSASTTPTHKLHFCSQTLAMMVKTIRMYKWASLNPIQSERGALFLEMEILPTFLLAPHPHINFIFVLKHWLSW